MITLLRCFWETGTKDGTKYAAGACLLYQLAEQRLTEMTQGCLGSELGALIHSVSLARSSRKRGRRGDIMTMKKRRTEQCGEGMNECKLLRFMGHGDTHTHTDVGKEHLQLLTVLN